MNKPREIHLTVKFHVIEEPNRFHVMLKTFNGKMLGQGWHQSLPNAVQAVVSRITDELTKEL
jgi:archaellum biogenesis protein FlaJ (TadC family)